MAGEGMQAEGTRGAGQGLGAAAWVSRGPPGPASEEAASAGSFWGMELPRPGLRKAASTDYSPKACVLGLMSNTLSMASLHGLAAEKDIALATAVLSPENTTLGGT